MKVHYFQRYHGKENVVTSNTMLMLSQLYSYSSKKFYALLIDNFLDVDEIHAPEVQFVLQDAGKKSVPDATITQASFRIVVETKLNNQFNIQQLLNHLNKFEKERYKVLLTLDPAGFPDDLKLQLNEGIKRYNKSHKDTFPVQHKHITFKELVLAIQSVVDERDMEMVDIVDDYRNYCYEENLIPDGEKWMRAITSGTTIQDNIELGLYYDLAKRGFRDHGYIGLYNQKSIRAIGRLKKLVRVRLNEQGEFSFDHNNDVSVSDDEKGRILEAIKRARGYEGYMELFNNYEHIFFLVDNFYPTDFIKSTPNPLYRTKLFNVEDIMKALGNETIPDNTKDIADALNGRTWSEFGY